MDGKGRWMDNRFVERLWANADTLLSPFWTSRRLVT